jgi:MFS family permease
MRSISKSFRRQDALYFLLSIIVVAIYVTTSGGGFPLDDSWIHQVYGRNLAWTGQWAFIPGVPSAASTSPLFTVLLAAGYWLGVPYALWTHLLGALALAVAAMLAARMAERLLPGKRHAGLITGLALVLAWHLIWAAASGMETMLFSTLILGLLWLAWHELDDRSSADWRPLLLRGMVFGAATALTALARPEGILMGGLVALIMLLVRPQGSWRAIIFWGSGAAISFALVIAPYLLLNFHLTGGLLPDTAAAKRAQNDIVITNTSYFTRLLEMAKPLIAGGQLLLIPGLIYFAATLRRRDDGRQVLLYLLPFLWFGSLIALYAGYLPAPYQHGRYVIPTLPALIVVGIAGTLELLQWGRQSPVRRVLTRTAAVSAGLAFVYFAFVLGPSFYRTDVRIIEEEMVAAARWIDENVPPDELLAIHDIGAVGYFTPRSLLDIAGLVTPEIIPIVADSDALWMLMRQREARYLMAFPDQVPGHEVDDPRLCQVFITDGPTSQSVGGPSMAVYRLAWDAICPS